MTVFHHSSRDRRRGSALLLALWALAILSFAILGIAKLIDARLDEDMGRQREARAVELAQCGLALAVHPNVRPGESILTREMGPGESFEAILSTEGSRISINSVLVDSKKRGILEKLFNLWGLSQVEADTVIDCLADWVDANDTIRLNGAEQSAYADEHKEGYPANQPFQSVDEMAFVKHMDLLEKKKPDWRDYFTVWSDGKIDLNEAPAEIIAAACEISLSQAESLVRKRNGIDGEPHTTDDVRYTDLNQVRLLLGLTQESFQSVANRVTIESNLKRILSTGKVGPYQRTISVVVRVNNQTIQYLEWLEQ